MFCPKCAAVNPDDAQFCQKCGQSFARGAVVTGTAPAPQYSPTAQKKWYEQSGIIILFLIFFFPVGLYLMWQYSKWHAAAKIIISIFFGIMMINVVVNGVNKKDVPVVSAETQSGASTETQSNANAETQAPVSSQKPQENDEAVSSKDEPKEEPKNEEEKTTFGTNEPATYKNTELTVTKVEISQGSDFDKPKDGMEYVIVTVKFRNVGSKGTISYNPFDFNMLNSKGQITDQAFSIVNSDTSLSSGDLVPGGEVEGTIVFEQPKGDSGLVLQYTGNLFYDESKISFAL